MTNQMRIWSPSTPTGSRNIMEMTLAKLAFMTHKYSLFHYSIINLFSFCFQSAWLIMKLPLTMTGFVILSYYWLLVFLVGRSWRWQKCYQLGFESINQPSYQPSNHFIFFSLLPDQTQFPSSPPIWDIGQGVHGQPMSGDIWK